MRTSGVVVNKLGELETVPERIPALDSRVVLVSVPVLESMTVLASVSVLDSMTVLASVSVLASVPVLDSMIVLASVPVLDPMTVLASVPVLDLVSVLASVPVLVSVPEAEVKSKLGEYEMWTVPIELVVVGISTVVFPPSPREEARLANLDCERLILGTEVVEKRTVLLVPEGRTPY
jgi:hypothetical protein